MTEEPGEGPKVVRHRRQRARGPEQQPQHEQAAKEALVAIPWARDRGHTQSAGEESGEDRCVELRRQAGAAERLRQPVVCYPARYDSVNFYLPDVPLRVFRRGEKRELIAYLEANPGSLVVIKSASYRELTRELPPDLYLRVRGRQGMVTVGRVIQDQPRLASSER